MFNFHWYIIQSAWLHVLVGVGCWQWRQASSLVEVTPTDSLSCWHEGNDHVWRKNLNLSLKERCSQSSLCSVDPTADALPENQCSYITNTTNKSSPQQANQLPFSHWTLSISSLISVDGIQQAAAKPVSSFISEANHSKICFNLSSCCTAGHSKKVASISVHGL